MYSDPKYIELVSLILYSEETIGFAMELNLNLRQ